MESSPSASSSCSYVARSIRPFDSDTESNPVWHDPETRLSRYKFLVASDMSALFHAGPEGQRILINDELRYRGSEPLVMKDRTTVVPTDILWWKEKRRFFATKLRHLEERERAGKLPTTTMLGPAANKIYDWIPAPSQPPAENQAPLRSPNKPRPNYNTTEHGKRKRDRYDTPGSNIQASKKSKYDGLPAPPSRLYRRETTATASQDLLFNHNQALSSIQLLHTETTRQSAPTSEMQPLRRSRRIMNLGDRDKHNDTKSHLSSPGCRDQQSKNITRGQCRMNALQNSSKGRLQDKRRIKRRRSLQSPAVDSRQGEILAQHLASTARRSARLAEKKILSKSSKIQ